MVRTFLFSFAVLLASGLLAAQDADTARFLRDLEEAFQFKDDKQIDKLVRSKPDKARRHFQDLRVEVWKGQKDLAAKTDALKASWGRVFDGSHALEKVERWVESQDPTSYNAYIKYQNNESKAWNAYLEAGKGTERAPYEQARDLLMEVAKQIETTGNKIEAAECWNLVAVCLSKIPDRTIQDRKDQVFALEQFVSYRKEWEFTSDSYFSLGETSLKTEKENIALAEKDAKKRKEEGYGENVKGIEALVVPGVAEEAHELAFEMLPAWDGELDYSQKGGPVPAFWWFAAFGKDATSAKMTWFRATELSCVRLSNSKFGVSVAPDDPKRTQEVEVGNKGKPTQFWLDADKKVPYAMFFWVGGDRERIGEAEVNLAPADTNTSVYYRSAASWKTSLGGEPLVVYDDNTSGKPMDGDPFEGKFPMHTLGKADAEAPLLDSMRVGKGPRVPFSEFVKAGTTWYYLHRKDDGKVGSRPLNPEYNKIGKVKLVWNGPKPTAPAQLVIEGSGDYKTACFDVASGKEVEVPAGKYRVIWGRVVQGKGARLQMATIYPRANEPFTVEEGKTFALEMGAPFKIAFERGGSEKEVRIDATTLVLQEKSGCILAEMQGMVLVPEVMAAKSGDGKGAKTIAKFAKLTDGDFLNMAANKKSGIGLMLACFPRPEESRDGTMDLTAKLPAEGMKVGLLVKKHPLFGKIESDWQ